MRQSGNTHWDSSEASSIWRRGWDSNPRSSYPDSSFRDCPIRPLSHLSAYDRSLAGLNIEQVGTTCSIRVPSLPCSVTFCNGLSVFLSLTRRFYQEESSYLADCGNDNSVNSACSSPRLTREAISSMRSILSTSSRRVLVLGWGGTKSLQQSWSGSIEVS